MRKLFFLPAILLLCWGCFDQGECLNQTSNRVSVRFYNKSDNKERNLQLDSVGVAGLPEVGYKASALSAISFPLDPTAAEAVVTLYTPNGNTILQFQYGTQATLLDPACAAATLFTLKSASVTGADSVRIVQPILTNISTTHVKVFF